MPLCLIVDDSKVVRKLERRYIEELGFSAEEADSGDTALVFCQAKIPDLILLDWYMPGMDGMEFLKAFRVLPGNENTKIVLCTTENNMEKMIYAMSLGANEYVIKPFDAEIIRLKLEQIGMM
jgi:two-component system, chemotaxis family, chemotaxis protein CheY